MSSGALDDTQPATPSDQPAGGARPPVAIPALISRFVIAAALVVLSGCLISPVIRFGGGKSAKQAQHDEAQQLTPPGLVVDSEWTGEVKVARIRVWADDEFRAQNMHWQRTFQDELDHANDLLAAMFGVRLEAEYRAWSRHAPGAPLSDSLAALEAEDPGTGVLTVVGLTSSLSLVSATFEQLGVASLSGNHLIVRGYADVEERTWFERAFRDLKPAEREALYTARRRHKTATLLLHELGHNLGAPHAAAPETIMSPLYSDHAASFDPASRETILATLDERLHRTHAAPVVATPATAPPPAPRSTPTPAPAATPAPRPAPTSAHPTLVVTLDASGTAIIGGRTVDDATLDELLHMSFADDPDTEVIVRASRRTPHEAAAKVLERAKAAGLHRIGMASAAGP